MNVYDSGQISKRLRPLGYRITESLDKAHLIILNTCAIREKAQQKAFSFLGRLAGLKRKRSGLVIGVGGCVAQQEGYKILEKLPYVDFVFGTDAIARLPSIIRKIESKKDRIADIKISEIINDSDYVVDSYTEKTASFITIMQGCNNFCTYCVVPYVRGRERSRSPEIIIDEIKHLVDSGVKEVTLLGQNVNSYGIKERLCSFSELLYRINEIDGLLRIRFTTSHPKDLSEELIYSFKNLEKLCNHIHLPVQSGSDRILKRMNRKYTKDQYLRKIDKLRDICPDIAVTSDFIVGFPGETEADFKETLNLINKVRYDSIFAFMYSDRQNAPAADFKNKISYQEKKDRLQRLLKIQTDISDKKNERFLGSTQMVLVDGLSKKQSCIDSEERYSIQWTGRIPSNRIVNFTQNGNFNSRHEVLTGKMVKVVIEKAFSHSLYGQTFNPHFS